jgi:hypothetical protein
MKKLDQNTRRVVNCLNASRRTLDPSFRAYWKDTAKKLATKNSIDLKEITKNLELYNAEVETSSIH